MELLITAPIRFKFSLNSAQTAFKNYQFFNFWNHISSLNYQDSKVDNFIYYKTGQLKNIDDESYDDESKTDMTLIGINLLEKSNDILSKLKKEDLFYDTYFNKITKSEIKVFDNTIALFDLRINVKNNLTDKVIFVDKSEQKVKKLLKEILLDISYTLDGFYNFLVKNDHYNIIQKKNKEQEYDNFVDLYRENKNLTIMWASCALKYEKKSDEQLDLLDYWLKDAIDDDKIEYLKQNSDSFSLEWLKYAFREDVENIEELWMTMFLAQYYYAVIEIIIYNLQLIINESYKINYEKKFFIMKLFRKNKIITVNQKLESISSSAYFHIIGFKDIKKYLKRNNLQIFNNILEAWTFDDLIDNTQDLLSTVKDRVNLIYNKISTKNNFYTDILLTFIGFFSIIDLVLNFSQYSREFTADAMINSRANDEYSILYYLSTIPTDIFIGSGFFIAFLLLVIYFIYRRKVLP